MAATDPLEAELAGAAVVSMMTPAAAQTGLDAEFAAELFTHVLLGRFIPTLGQRASTEAMAMLLALGSVADGQVAAAAAETANRLTRAGVTRPHWADALAAPLSTDSCWRFSDPGETESIMGASFIRAGRSHTMLIHVDALDCGAATDITVLEAEELPEALAILRAGDSYDTGDDGTQIIEETLDAEQWRWQLENALDARAVHDGADGLDLEGLDCDELDPDQPDGAELGPASYAALAVVLRARLATMPASPKPKAPHGCHGEDLSVEFTALALPQRHRTHAVRARPGGQATGQTRQARPPA